MTRIPAEMTRLISTFFTCILFPFPASGNAAQPGMWNTGTGHEFIPLIAEDSMVVGKIRMVKEEISILLFPGFAVVRGEYEMQNLTDSGIFMTVGYPVNGEISQDEIQYLMFDDLYAIRIYVNDSMISAGMQTLDDTLLQNSRNHIWGTSEWYTWKMNFRSGQNSRIRVYFIVNTNNSLIRDGYFKTNSNGFSYILESGKAWAGTIGSGEIRISLRGGLKANDIQGILPAGSFSWDKGSRMTRTFTDLEPEMQSNVVIRYAKRMDDFDFDAILKKQNEYFASADSLFLIPWKPEEFEVFTAADFRVPGIVETVGDWAKNLVLNVTIGAIVLALIIYLALRYRNRRPIPHCPP